MQALLIITLLLLLTSGGILIYCCYKDNPVTTRFGVSCSILLTFMAIITVSVMFSIPQAIDVYRENTRLQVTYVDNTPVDSVVVFKTYKE